MNWMDKNGMGKFCSGINYEDKEGISGNKNRAAQVMLTFLAALFEGGYDATANRYRTTSVQ